MTEESKEIKPLVGDLVEVYDLLKSDATNLLRDLLNGVSMWGTTAMIAFFLTLSWLVLTAVITIVGRPYGSPPNGLDSIQVLYLWYLGIILAIASGITTVFLFSRYYSLKRKYSRLFKIAEKLR